MIKINSTCFRHQADHQHLSVLTSIDYTVILLEVFGRAGLMQILLKHIRRLTVRSYAGMSDIAKVVFIDSAQDHPE